MRTCVLSPKGYQDPALEPVLGKGSVSERLVADPSSMGSSRAQPEKETWVCPHVGPPPPGGAMKLAVGTLNVTSWMGKEPDLMQEVEIYRLDIVGLTSIYSSCSGTNYLERDWTLCLFWSCPR